MKPEYWIFADTEDDSEELLAAGRSGFEKRVTEIAAIGEEPSLRFYNQGNVVEFLQWLSRLAKKKRLVCWFHNLSYDLGNLFGRALDMLDVVAVGSRLIRAQFNGITFKDSWNFWNCSLEKIGEAIGLPKLKRKPGERVVYVCRDVEILRAGMMVVRRLANRHGCKQIPSTIGGLSVDLWRHLGGSNWYCDDEFARSAYYGGRVELFAAHRKGRIHWLDFNSLYPWALAQRFPTKTRPMKPDLFYHDVIFTQLEGIIEATVEVPKSFLTPLPVRREDGSIWFPHGILRGCWTIFELRNACRNFGAKVRDIHHVEASADSQPYYRKFAHHFYAQRVRVKSEAENEVFKRLLNHFYGQLALSGIISRTQDLDRVDHVPPDAIAFGRKILCNVRIPLEEHCNYVHAAYVTSFARVHLLNALREYRPEQLIYCDTDSIIAEGPIPKGIAISNEILGAMKLVSWEKEVWTYAPKTYRTRSVAKAKGVPRKLAMDYIKRGWAEFDEPFQYREAALFYDRGNKRQLSVWRKVRKEMTGRYDRKTLNDGSYFPKKHVDK